MARRPRYQLPGGLVHVTARGNRRQQIVLDDRDRERLLGTVSDVDQRFDVRWLAFCLMDNHYHFLVEGSQADLSDAMHRLNGTYAQAFNRRHGLDGHLFQDRFHAVAILSEWHFFEVLRYVVLNPVRAGVCSYPADFRWSSYRATAGLAHAPRFLAVERVLAHFGDDRQRAQSSFAAFVHEAVPEAARLSA
jgi:putative transposase